MSSTTLKLIALVLMLIDHIGEFIPGTPLWLRWIGRLSAPIFFYCAAQGLTCTHDRKKYLLRLYLFGVAMASVNLLCNNVFYEYGYISNNIFVTIFVFGFLASLAELWKSDWKRAAAVTVPFLIIQYAAVRLAALAGGSELVGTSDFIGALTGSAILCEGGLEWVLMGLALYWGRSDKRRLTVAYLAVSLYFLADALAYDGWNMGVLLYQKFQWMMVFSLPLMLLYNGKRGAGLKYLFYFFYPLHVLLLFFIMVTMA